MSSLENTVLIHEENVAVLELEIGWDLVLISFLYFCLFMLTFDPFTEKQSEKRKQRTLPAHTDTCGRSITQQDRQTGVFAVLFMTC